MTRITEEQSLSEVHQSIDTRSPNLRRKFLAFLGPAYLVSVGYMDPGNWATDIAGGSMYGYSLIWVLLMSNLMALLLQGLSARLGIVRGRDLAQANRETYPRSVNFILYILAETAIAACDLAEVLGMAIGLQLLTGLPLAWGVGITVLDTFLLLYLQKAGMRFMEAFIIALVVIIFVCFGIQIFLAKPDLGEVAKGFAPVFKDQSALYIAIGIIGATVMPHNLYLHSALVQSRKIDRTDAGIRQALKFNRIDTTIALNLAFFVNAAILVLAGSLFYESGNTGVAEIKEAHRLLPSFLGDLAPILFAVALIAAGQSSTVTGTLAGQIVMEGYLRLRLNPWLRRLITRLIAITPALIVILIYGEDEVDSLLVFSQVVLSLQLGFAIIPLIGFVSDKEKMGKFAITKFTGVLASLIAAVLIFLNLKMLWNEASPLFEGNNLLAQISVIVAGAFFLGLLGYITFFHVIRKQKVVRSVAMHEHAVMMDRLDIPAYKKIAVALDFSASDRKIIAHAAGQASPGCSFVLIHVVESVSAVLHGAQSADKETKEDAERLAGYAAQLKDAGFDAVAELGYNYRVKEIVRVINESNADLLVMGAHGHSGLKDIVYGQTVNAVRHEISIPLLIVNL